MKKRPLTYRIDDVHNQRLSDGGHGVAARVLGVHGSGTFEIESARIMGVHQVLCMEMQTLLNWSLSAHVLLKSNPRTLKYSRKCDFLLTQLSFYT